jgi:hypothetical protein
MSSPKQSLIGDGIRLLWADLNSLAGPWIELETPSERLLQVFDENPYLSGHPAARRPHGKDWHCSFKGSE